MESRFEAFHASGLTELVGREEELDLLLRRWSKAKTGEGQVVLLSGEPGIGKSRLIAALSGTARKRAAYAPALFLLTAAHRQCAYPFIARWNAPQDSRTTTPSKRSSTNWMRCSRRLDRDERRRAVCASCCHCRMMPLRPSSISPQQKRQKIFEAMLSQLEGLRAQRPVLMVFEDAHWIDPTIARIAGSDD